MAKISEGEKNKLFILIATAGLLTFLLLAGAITFRDLPFSLLFPKPAPKAVDNISTPTEVKIGLTKGTVTSKGVNSLTVSTATTSATFSITQTQEFQRLISGTVEAGDTQTETVSAQELQEGQEVLVIWDKAATESAKAIYILK